VSLSRLVAALSTSPARIAGIDPPSIREGAPAVLTLCDPSAEWVPAETPLQSKSKNTPFYRRTLRGRVLMTLVDGKVAFEAGADAPDLSRSHR
jgi:dihydroorotase